MTKAARAGSPLRAAVESTVACSVPGFALLSAFPPGHSSDKLNLDGGASQIELLIADSLKSHGRDIFQKSGHSDINGDVGPVENVTFSCQIAEMPS